MRGMLNHRLCCALLLVALYLVAHASPALCLWPFGGDEKNTPPKIAVITEADLHVPGMNEMPAGKVLPDAVGDRIMDHLARSKRFNVVEKATLHRILQERGKEQQVSTLGALLDFVLKKASTTDTPLFSRLREVGIEAQADYMLIGALEELGVKTTTTNVPGMNLSVTKGETNARMRLRIIDVETASIAGVIDLAVSEDIDFSKTGNDVSRQFIENLSRIAAARVLDELHPAKLVKSGQNLALTRGSNEGVLVGDLFEILRPGEEIKDGGIVLGTLDSPVGAVRVTSAQATLSLVEPVSGGPLQEGDLARIMQPAQAEQSASGGSAARSAAPQYGGKKLAADKNAITDKFHIAVGRFRIESPNASIRQWLERHITGDLLVKLQNTKRFVVSEREELAQISEEMLLTASTQGTDIQEAIAGIKGVDYILTGSLRTMELKATVERVPYVNETIVSDPKGATESVVRIIDAHTGQVVSAEKIAFVHNLDSEGGLNEFLDQYTSEVTSRVMLGLFPIKVMAATPDGRVYVNRGTDGGVKTGQVYDVFRPGQELIDPDTGLSLGTTEQMVGTIRIATVDRAKAIADTVSGQGFTSGDILRAAKKAPKAKPQASQPPQPAISW